MLAIAMFDKKTNSMLVAYMTASFCWAVAALWLQEEYIILKYNIKI